VLFVLETLDRQHLALDFFQTAHGRSWLSRCEHLLSHLVSSGFSSPRATRAGEESETRLLRAGCCVSTPLLCAQHRNTASRPARRELSARSCVLSVSHLVVQQMRRRSKRASGGSMDRTVAGRSCCSSSCRQTRACSASRTCCATASWLPCRPLYPRLSVAVCLQMSVAVCLCSRLLCVACTGAPLSSPSAA
jgi:hypothetical protein